MRICGSKRMEPGLDLGAAAHDFEAREIAQQLACRISDKKNPTRLVLIGAVVDLLCEFWHHRCEVRQKRT